MDLGTIWRHVLRPEALTESVDVTYKSFTYSIIERQYQAEI